MSKKYKALILPLMLTILWMVLSGVFNVVQVVAGIVSVISITILIKYSKNNPYNINVSLYKYFIYNIWLAKEIFKSNLKVAYAVIIPSKAQPTIVYMPHKLKSKQAIAILANSITLTAGSFAIEENPNFIIIHSLFSVDNLEDFNNTIHNKILEMEITN